MRIPRVLGVSLAVVLAGGVLVVGNSQSRAEECGTLELPVVGCLGGDPTTTTAVDPTTSTTDTTDPDTTTSTTQAETTTTSSTVPETTTTTAVACDTLEVPVVGCLGEEPTTTTSTSTSTTVPETTTSTTEAETTTTTSTSTTVPETTTTSTSTTVPETTTSTTALPAECDGIDFPIFDCVEVPVDPDPDSSTTTTSTSTTVPETTTTTEAETTTTSTSTTVPETTTSSSTTSTSTSTSTSSTSTSSTSTSSTTSSTTTTTAPAPRPAEITTGPGQGGGPHVRSFDNNGSPKSAGFYGYDESFTGGVPVARGDLDGDGTDEIVTGSGPGGNAVAAYKADGTPIFGLAPFGAFRGGANVAVGDVVGDATPEIVVGAGPGGGPVVRVLSNTGQFIGNGFYAYPSGFAGGVNVAVAQVAGDDEARIVTAPQSNGGPHVKRFRANGEMLGQFFAYAANFNGGVFVSAANLGGTGNDEIVTGPNVGGGPHVKAFTLGGGEIGGFFAYNTAFLNGVRVASGDVDGDAPAEIITGAGPGGGPHVRAFDADGSARGAGFYAYAESFNRGVFVALAPSE